ncbi:MAG: hypothetical protein J6D21_02425 [Clostridia bacterium]|nr:hypothetical protein [Clostridia bacterium]
MENHIFLKMIDEIEACLEHELYMSALMLALTIPDICGKAEYPHAKYIVARYTGWYNQYMEQYHKGASAYDVDLPYLSGEVVYNLRNSIFHSGNPNIDCTKVQQEECKIDQFELHFGKSLLGDTSAVSYGAGMKIVERRYEVNVYLLCSRLCSKAREYYADNTEKFDFFNYSIQYYDA